MMLPNEPVASANAGRTSRFQSDVVGPAWLRFALIAMRALTELRCRLGLRMVAGMLFRLSVRERGVRVAIPCMEPAPALPRSSLAGRGSQLTLW
jgi:hypothetical protein